MAYHPCAVLLRHKESIKQAHPPPHKPIRLAILLMQLKSALISTEASDLPRLDLAKGISFTRLTKLDANPLFLALSTITLN